MGGPVSLLLPPGCTMELGARARRLLGEDDFGNAVRPYPNGACPGTGNVIIRRDVLEQVGGFDPAFAQGGEDAELFGRVRAAGLRILYAPEARMQHVIPPGRLRPDFFRWVARRIGVADARIYHKHVSLAGILRRVVLRVGALALRDGPIVMLWPRSGQRRLDAICSMQYTLAFVRGIASFVAPDVFSNERYIRGLHFSNHGGERGHEVRA